MAHSRRDFFSGLGCAFLSRVALYTGAEKLFAINALAGPGAPAGDYKALVCVFMFGGNDANNLIIPVDEYTLYADPGNPRTRVNAAIQIQLNELANTQITPPSDGRTYGLHPRMTALHNLWSQGKAAAVVNAGTLIRPTTRQEFRTDPRFRPYQLFSHSDQQTEWQAAYGLGPIQTGWGGRTADIQMVGESGFPTITSVAGVTIFSAGRRTRPLVIPPHPTEIRRTLRLNRAEDAREGSALRALIEADNVEGSPILVRGAAKLTDQAVRNSILLDQDDPEVGAFPTTSLGNQLHQIAKLITLSSQIGIQRQIFFASRGGFDTHDQQGAVNGNQGNLLFEVSEAIQAFYDFTVNFGFDQQVTAFTMSDFSRTFNPGANGRGTDHAWGSHQFVIGGAVNGGDFYGRYPLLVMDGDEDADAGANARGRWIPTTSIEQYAATLALWFGVLPSDLPQIFPNPNIGEFSPIDLGFMSSGAARPARSRVRG